MLMDNYKSPTLTQLCDLGVKHSEARLHHLRSQDRRHYNQHLMARVGRGTEVAAALQD